MIWPPPREALEGSIVRLEPLEPAHEAALAAVSADPQIWIWMDRTVPEGPEAFGRWFGARMAAMEAGADWTFATIDAGTGEAIGSSSYLAVRPEHDGLEIGNTWLAPSAWRTGANVEAKLLMMGQAFDRLGAMRVEFKTDARNERSRNALAALPAKFEGIFRHHMNMPVVGVRDSAYFSVIDDEWPAVRANLEARLARARDGESARA